ncbi:MAG: ATP-binding protein [Bacteroidaceae bacterium]
MEKPKSHILNKDSDALELFRLLTDLLLFVSKDLKLEEIIVDKFSIFSISENDLAKPLTDYLVTSQTSHLLRDIQAKLLDGKQCCNEYNIQFIGFHAFSARCTILPYKEGIILDFRNISIIDNSSLTPKNAQSLFDLMENDPETIFACKKNTQLVFANKFFRNIHPTLNGKDLSTSLIKDLDKCSLTKGNWIENIENLKPGHSYTHTILNPFKYENESFLYKAESFCSGGHDDSNGSDDIVWTFIHDLSKQSLYEQQTNELIRLLRLISNKVHARITVKDPFNNYSYIYRNQYKRNPIDSPETMIGKDDFDVYPYYTALEKRIDDFKVVLTGTPSKMRFINPGEDGKIEVWEQNKFRFTSNNHRPILVSITSDITEIELIRRNEEAQRHRADQSNWMKSTFLANMSHEIRTPLNAIIGFSRIISETDNATDRKDYYDIVETNTERLLNLINEILNLSKIEAGTLEFKIDKADLQEICNEVLDAHSLRCPPNVSLQFTKSPEELIFLTDKNRINQIFSNLIGNAFKYTSKGLISFGYELTDDDKILCYVSDTGTGIPADKIDAVFERFNMAGSNVSGTGLGLSISEALVKNLGGDIWAESKIGEGTTFKFTLPYKVPEGIAKRTNEDDFCVNKSSKDKKTSILIAEDNDSDYKLLEYILQDEYHLIRSIDGIEAIMLLEKNNPDLILMNLKMPNLDGLSTTQIIRESGKDTPIIGLGIYSLEEEKKSALEAGFIDFIKKPIQEIELKDKIKKYLRIDT